MCPHCIAAGVSLSVLALSSGSIALGLRGSWAQVTKALRMSRVDTIATYSNNEHRKEA